MSQSEELGELFAALAAAQGEMKVAEKRAAGHHNKYADVQTVWQTWQKVGPKHGLALVAMPQRSSGGVSYMSLKLLIGHSSGQWISGEYPINPTKADPQGLGSAITYARRYGIQAATGQVSGEDDDGVAASGDIPLWNEGGDILRELAPPAFKKELSQRMKDIAVEKGSAEDLRRKLKYLWLANGASRRFLEPDDQEKLDTYYKTLGRQLSAGEKT